MKGKNTVFPRVAGAILGILLGFSLATCQAVNAGLGPKIDLYPPTISITSPSTNSYLKGTITLQGKAADDLSLKSVEVTYPSASGSKTLSATLNKDGTWTCNIPSGTTGSDNLPDGQQTLVATAIATSGKTTQTSVIINVDNIPPTVLVSAPSSHGSNPPAYSDYVDISGSAWDPSPISSVVVTLYLGSTQIAQQQADGTNVWSTRFKLKDTDNGPLHSSNDGAIISYMVSVTDAAGNTNSYYYHQQDIYNILPAGTLFPTTTELGKLDQAGKGTSTPSNIPFASLYAVRLDGTTNPLANLKFSYQSFPILQYFNLSPSVPAAQNLLGPGTGIYGVIIPPSTTAIDTNTLQFQLWNTSSYYAMNPVQGSPASPALSPVITLTAANTYNGQLTLSPVGGSENFSIALKDSSGNELSPGSYTIAVTAAAQGSATLVAHQDFIVDANAPTLTETAVGSSLAYRNQKSGFTLSGTAESAAGLYYVEIDQSTDGGLTYPQTTKVNLSGTQASWTSPPLPLPQTTGADGSYSYRITLMSLSTKTAILYRSVIFDTTPPTAIITAPSSGSWQSTNPVTLNATTADATSGVAQYYWLIDSASVDHSAEVTTWATTNGQSPPTSSWTSSTVHPLNSYSYTLPSEGLFKLWVVAVDHAGNTMPSATTTIFGYDNAPPALGFNNPPSSSYNTATANSFTGFTGTISDTDPASVLTGTSPTLKLSVSATLNSNTQTLSAPVITANAGTSNVGTWSLPFTIKTDGSMDGQWKFTFTATDVAGNSVTYVKTFTVDTQAPTFTVTAPGGNAWANSNTLSVTGVATDNAGTGVAAVYVKADSAYVAPNPPSMAVNDDSAQDPVAADTLKFFTLGHMA